MSKVEVLENGNIKITIPMALRSCAGRKRIITPDSETSFTDPMLINLARAFRWQALIDEGKFSNVHDLAKAIGKDEAYVSRLTRLTLLAPEIVHYIISGKLDKAGAKKCREPFPELWDEQIKFFGIK